MKKNKLQEVVVDTIIQKLSLCSCMRTTVSLSLWALFISCAFVYIATLTFCYEYSSILFGFAIAVPLILTPVIVYILILLSKRLTKLQEKLEQEKEQSRKKDVMLFEQNRFVLMGEMMANISHQWKQPLNTINLAILTAKTTNPKEQNLDKYFDIMEDNVIYLASTIDNFMSFFDKKTYLEVRELSFIIKEIKSIIEAEIKNKYIDLKIETEISKGKIFIASFISQVILNLVSNAKDAFDENIEKKIINLKFTSLYDGLQIECCDNGTGIPLEIREKIFEPYFTTKKKLQGTGIGLYMSKQIVQEVFGGNIEIGNFCSMSKECHDSTCFKVFLPYSKNCILKEAY